MDCKNIGNTLVPFSFSFSLSLLKFSGAVKLGEIRSGLTGRFAIVDPKTNKELTAEDIGVRAISVPSTEEVLSDSEWAISVPCWVERFDQRRTEPFELLTSEFGQSSVNIQYFLIEH